MVQRFGLYSLDFEIYSRLSFQAPRFGLWDLNFGIL